MAIQCSASHVALESDCLEVIMKIKAKQIEDSYLGFIIKDILCLVKNFDCISFHHISRDANGAAHEMPHLFPLEYSTRVGVDGCPNDVLDVIASDFCLALNESQWPLAFSHFFLKNN